MRQPHENLRNRGASLILADLNQEAVESLSDELRAISSDICFKTVDVSNELQVVELINFASTQFGRLDCLFNNAGVGAQTNTLDEVPVEDWQRVININLTGVFF